MVVALEFMGERSDDRLGRLILREIAPEFGANELGAVGPGADHPQDVLAGKVAGLAEESLGAVVVILRVVLEVDAVLVQAPAGVGFGGLLDVLLGVVAFAEGEELHHLAREIFVRVILVALARRRDR